MEGANRDPYYYPHTMNRSFDSFKGLFAKLRAHRGGSSDHGVIHPLREWFGALLAGVLLVVVGAGWATQVFWHYDEMVKNPTFLETASDPTYREAMVSQALTTLETRQQQYSQLERRLRGEEADAVVGVTPPVTATTTASTTPREEEVQPVTPTASTAPMVEEVPAGEVEMAN